MASFEELMKQVESLKKENSTLRRELQDNSSHLTKLETEAGNMKDVLTHLHHSAIQDDDQENFSHTEEMNSFNSQNESSSMLNITDKNDAMLDHNSNESGDESLQDKGWSHIQAVNNQILQKQARKQQQQEQIYRNKQQHDELNSLRNNSRTTNNTTDVSGVTIPTTITTTTDPNLNPLVTTTESDITQVPPVITSGRDLTGSGSQKSSHTSSPSEGPAKKRSGEKEFYNYLQELDQKRKALLQDIENDERQRKWYCEQLEALKRQADDLPVTDQYKNDMSRRQLDYEMQRLRDLMKENMGSTDDMAQKHETRLQRIHMIESEMLRVQQIHKGQVNNDQAPFTYQDELPTDSATGKALNAQTLPLDNSFNGGRLITIATQTSENNSGLVGTANLPQIGSGSEEAGYRNQNLSALYHGSWPLERDGHQPQQNEVSLSAIANQETVSVMSFRTNNTSSSMGGGRQSSNVGESNSDGVGFGPGNGMGGGGLAYGHPQHQHLGTKVEMVYGLLSMLGTHDKEDMSRTLLAMSSSQDSCIAMRQSGCLPLLIQLLHGSDSDNGLLGKTRGSKAARARAAAALHNIVHSHPDDKRGRREARVLRLLEQIRAHCDQLRSTLDCANESVEQPAIDSKADMDHHPGPAIAALMKLSFDEEHRHAICTLGGLQGIAELLQIDHEVNGNTSEQYNITMRRYACMALTNLTFGDGTNKALLCSMKPSMRGLVAQLQSPNEDLRQVAASVLRNLSWRADLASKKILREVGSVSALTRAAMEVQKESTMKSVLSALWNLSAHCSENKADVCAVDGALAFLVATLMYKSPSKTLSIIENGGGILRNISSHIAIREEYRMTLRQHGCLQILLKHLRSPSLTIVSNACGTLWNLSARCVEDQKALWELGAVSMLKNLVNSKHKMISMGSAAALKNLLNARPNLGLENDLMFGSTNKPGLHIRKQRALEAEIDPNLSETCENMESPTDSPTHTSKNGNSNRRHDQRNNKLQFMYSSEGSHHQQPIYGQNSLTMNMVYNHHRMTASDMSPFIGGHHQIPNQHGNNTGFTRPVSRSGSQDSVGSVHSDISHDRTRQMLIKSSKLLEAHNGTGDVVRSYSPHGRHHSHHQHQQHRNNVMSKSHDPHSSQHRSRSDSADRSQHHHQPNNHPQHQQQHLEHPNRIMQMMKEVAKHSGLDSNNGSGGAGSGDSINHMGPPLPHNSHLIQYSIKESHSADNTPQVSRRSQAQNASFHEMPNKQSKVTVAASRLSAYSSSGGGSHNNANTTTLSSSSSSSKGSNGSYGNISASTDTHCNIKSSHINSSQHMDVSHLSRNMEKLHLTLDDDQGPEEKPIDFTIKYSDSEEPNNSNTNTGPTTTAVTTNTVFSTGYSNNSVFRPSHPQVNNYVGSYNTEGNSNANKQEQNNVVNVKSTTGIIAPQLRKNATTDAHALQQQRQQSQTSNKSHSNNISNRNKSSNSWVIDNNDIESNNDEHPTNYSARYIEEEESESHNDLPIDFSSRYNNQKDSSSNSNQQSSSSQIKTQSGLPHYQQHLSSMDDDQVIPFCTEGTPLNFLSTATSLTDLSKINEHEEDDRERHSENSKSAKDDLDLDASRDEVTDFASRNAEHDESHGDSLPSDRNTSSTLVTGKDEGIAESDSPKSTFSNTVSGGKGSGIHSQVPSLYSYNDHSSMSASPSEKPVKYCTEGTPSSFSRRSSLSSLHGSETNDGSSSNHSKQQDLTLQAIDENDSLDISHNMTLKANGDSADNSIFHPNQGKVPNPNDSGSSGHNTKTVTFDNHVQETPLMFSRCSSLGSLSSFDAHSVHSSVMSDYSNSRRTSGMVSPSELPDSPGDTMPPTPKARRSPPPIPPKLSFTPPGKPPLESPAGTPVTVINRMREVPNVIRKEDRKENFNVNKNKTNEVNQHIKNECDQDSALNNEVNVNNHLGDESGKAQLSAAVLNPHYPYTSSEIVKKYHVEGSPDNSCATSLSALTFDDEPVIKKEPTLKRIPLGIDDGKSDKTESTQSPSNEKEDLNEEIKELEKKDDESDISDISDDDGNDSPVSESEENMLLECISLAMPAASGSSAANKKKMKKSASDNVLKDSASGSNVNVASSSSVISSNSRVPMIGQLTRSNTTPNELSKLAVVAPMQVITQNHGRQQQQHFISNSYNYSINNANKGVKAQNRSGQPFNKYASVSGDNRINNTRPVNSQPPLHQNAYSSQQHQYQSHDIGYDSPKKYATEGTPLEFSRATSLSDLTIDDHQREQEIDSPDKTIVNNDSKNSNLSDLDLSDDGGDDLLSEVIEAAMPKSKKQLSVMATFASSSSSKTKSANSVQGTIKSIDHSANVSETKDELKKSTRQQQSYKLQNQQQNKENTQPPALPPRMPYSSNRFHQHNKQPIQYQPDGDVGDTVRSYAVEGTPLEFSRATSLSDLHDIGDIDNDNYENHPFSNKSDITKDDAKVHKGQEHETREKFENSCNAADVRPVYDNDHVDYENDAIKTYAVEDTPYNFSRKTSFSDLTIDDDDVHAVLEDDQSDSNEGSSLNMTDQTSKSLDVTVYHNKVPYTPGIISALDSPKCYATEGTPLNYSRNDSLSSLSGDEDEKEDTKSVASKTSSVSSKKADGKTFDKQKQGMIPRKLGIQSPAIARLKTPNKPFKYQPSMHSTPAPKGSTISSSDSAPQCLPVDDQVMNFAVEDTPVCYSRNSSLSSLDSNEHEGMANHSGGSGDSDPVKDSPGAKQATGESSSFSRQSRDSFSSLSAESLSFEPNELESALLEECISSAMPKSNKSKKSGKDVKTSEQQKIKGFISSPLVQNQQYAATNLVNYGLIDTRTPTTAAVVAISNPTSNSKNLQGPQAEIETTIIPLKKEDIQLSMEQNVQAEIENFQQEMIENMQVVETEKQAIVKKEKIHVAVKIEENQVGKENTPIEKDTSEFNDNQINNNVIINDDNQFDDGEADADRLAQTFAELECQFADLGMIGNVPINDDRQEEQILKNLCLEAETNFNSSNNREIANCNVMQLSSDSLDFGSSSKGSETKSSPQNDQISEKSSDSLDMSSSKMSLGKEAKNVIEIINEEKETAPSDKSTDSLDLGSSSKQLGSGGGSDIITDIMKESFPDMTSSLTSNITTPDQEAKHMAELLTAVIENIEVGNTSQESSNNQTLGYINSANITAVFTGEGTAINEKQERLSGVSFDQNSDNDSFDITAEEERILAENANLILSELSQMVSSQTSAGDDDAFIENEHLSLICSSGPTDTGSDTSMTASIQPIPRSVIVSESITEDGDSISTVMQSESYQDIADIDDEVRVIEKPRPRIVKPVFKLNQQEDTSPKGIRGMKKVIKGRPPPANATRQSSPSWRTPSPNNKTMSCINNKKTDENTKNVTTTTWMKKQVPKTSPKSVNVTQRQGSPISHVNSSSPSPKQGLPKPQQIFSSPFGPRKNGIPLRSSPGPGILNKQPLSKTSPLAQKENNTPKSGQKITATVRPSPPRRQQFSSKPAISQTQIKSPKPSGLPKPGQPSKLKWPQEQSKVQNSNYNNNVNYSKKNDENVNFEEMRPKLPAKQGTFVKDEPSQYMLYQINNENQSNINVDNGRKSISPPGSNRNSDELKYRAEESGKATPPASNRNSEEISSKRKDFSSERQPGSIQNFKDLKSRVKESTKPKAKSPVEISSVNASNISSPSTKSDHGNFTVAEFDGAWEGTNFTVCEFSGAWKEARDRHKSGGSGSGSNGETPPIQRRSIVIDDSFDNDTGVKRRSFIIDESFDYSTSGSASGDGNDVFESQSSSISGVSMGYDVKAATQAKTAIPITASKQITGKQATSRLPQSRLAFPSTKGAVLSSSSSLNKTGESSASLNRSSSSGSSSSIRKIATPTRKPATPTRKPTTPPRASSLSKGSGIPSRSHTPQGRSTSVPGRTVTPPNRKNSIEALSSQNSRSSTPQSRKSSISSVNSNSNSNSTVPTKKGATSKIAGLWKKDKKESKKEKTEKQNIKVKLSKSEKKKKIDQTSEEHQNGGLKRSGTYDKLVIMAGAPDISGLSGSENDDAAKMPPPALTPQSKSLWRRTYTIDDDKQQQKQRKKDSIDISQENFSDAMADSAHSSQDEGGLAENITTKKSKRRSLFRKSRSDSSESINNSNNKKEKSEGPATTSIKKRFSLFRKDNSDKGESKIPSTSGGKSGRKSGIWLKKKSDIEHDINSPNGDLVIELPSDKKSLQQNGGGDLHYNINKPNAAIVQPFNYKPNHLPITPVHQMNIKEVQMVTTSVVNSHSQQSTSSPASSQPDTADVGEKKMTKTEMLMARRRKTNMNSGSEASLESTEDGTSKKGSSSYLVTTV